MNKKSEINYKLTAKSNDYKSLFVSAKHSITKSMIFSSKCAIKRLAVGLSPNSLWSSALPKSLAAFRGGWDLRRGRRDGKGWEGG